jgi:hypothetical protein
MNTVWNFAMETYPDSQIYMFRITIRNLENYRDSASSDSTGPSHSVKSSAFRTGSSTTSVTVIMMQSWLTVELFVRGAVSDSESSATQSAMPLSTLQMDCRDVSRDGRIHGSSSICSSEGRSSGCTQSKRRMRLTTPGKEQKQTN